MTSLKKPSIIATPMPELRARSHSALCIPTPAALRPKHTSRLSSTSSCLWGTTLIQLFTTGRFTPLGKLSRRPVSHTLLYS